MRGLLFLTIFFGITYLSPAAVQADSPNVVLIVADDLSSKYLSAYHRGGVKTPHLERLAREGIKFVNYVSPPICNPARAALVTSRSPKYTHIYHNDLRPRAGQDVNQFLTLGNMFKAAGYATGFVGKWNISGRLLHYDTARVWDFAARSGCAMENAATASRYWYPAVGDETGERIPTSPTDFGPDFFASHGLAFIREKLATNTPFFLHYAMVEPHAIRGNDSPNVPGAFGASPKQRYRNLIAYMDGKIGDVIQAVQGTNTIVIFLADNPTATEGKSWATPKGVFVPCMVWGRGIASLGSSTELLSAHDIMPTLGRAIAAPKFVTDGRDHYDYWTGAVPITSPTKMSYIGTSQILVTKKDFFVRDAVRGNAKGILTRARGKRERPQKAAHRRYGRALAAWCGPLLHANRGVMSGTGSFAKRWIRAERSEVW